MLANVVPATAAQFARAIAMPNLKPPVATVRQALEYRERILEARPVGSAFEPLMVLYLTSGTTAAEVVAAAQDPHVYAIKLYPAGATTHSQAGVEDISALSEVFAAMEEEALPLLVHGETTSVADDIFRREELFLERTLAPLLERFAALRLVLEHVTTRHAVDFVGAAGPNVAATITPQHLLLNRNALFEGGLQPHHYCLPVLKTEDDRVALVEAATSGNPKFFLGTDSAPHLRHTKETSGGCAGVYSAASAIELYAEAFDRAGALDRLEGFASLHGPAFYGLPANEERIVLQRSAWKLPPTVPVVGGELVPFFAGQQLSFQLASR